MATPPRLVSYKAIGTPAGSPLRSLPTNRGIYESPMGPEGLAEDEYIRAYNAEHVGRDIPMSEAQREMVNRGLPQGPPAWARDLRRSFEGEAAPGFGSSQGLTDALAAQSAVDPTRGAMANYRYALAQRLAQRGQAPSYADLGGASAAAGQAGIGAQQERSRGLLEALGQAGAQDTRIEASNADWALQRAALGRRVAGMGLQDKREQYNRLLDAVRARAFQGQIEQRRSLADQLARNAAARELIGAGAQSAGALLSYLAPGGKGDYYYPDADAGDYKTNVDEPGMAGGGSYKD